MTLKKKTDRPFSLDIKVNIIDNIFDIIGIDQGRGADPCGFDPDPDPTYNKKSDP